MSGSPTNPRSPRVRVAEFRFYEELNDFLAEQQRKRSFPYRFRGTPSVLDAIQALGVPHSAVDLVLVDGKPVEFAHRLEGGERIAVYPMFERLDIGSVSRLRPQPLRRTRFLLDVHLGRLARDLRMLGFDAVWSREWDDSTIIDRALQQRRVILTRDRGILKNRRVTHGYWLRAQQPAAQLREVLEAFDLRDRCEPFSRCMDCNGLIRAVSKDCLRGRIDPAIMDRFDAFRECRDCGKVYWPGFHYQRMQRRIEGLTAQAIPQEATILKERDP